MRDDIELPPQEEYQWTSANGQLELTIRTAPRSWTIQLPLQGGPGHYYVAGVISISPSGRYVVDGIANPQEFNTFEECLEYFMMLEYAKSQAPKEGGEAKKE
jgi:hypothetical protein